MTTTKKIGVLVAFIITGFFMVGVPSPIDIGETILISLASNCQTEQCIENSNTLLNYYHIGGLILGLGGVVLLIRELR